MIGSRLFNCLTKIFQIEPLIFLPRLRYYGNCKNPNCKNPKCPGKLPRSCGDPNKCSPLPPCPPPKPACSCKPSESVQPLPCKPKVSCPKVDRCCPPKPWPPCPPRPPCCMSKPPCPPKCCAMPKPPCPSTLSCKPKRPCSPQPPNCSTKSNPPKNSTCKQKSPSCPVKEDSPCPKKSLCKPKPPCPPTPPCSEQPDPCCPPKTPSCPPCPAKTPPCPPKTPPCPPKASPCAPKAPPCPPKAPPCPRKSSPCPPKAPPCPPKVPPCPPKAPPCPPKASPCARKPSPCPPRAPPCPPKAPPCPPPKPCCKPKPVCPPKPSCCKPKPPSPCGPRKIESPCAPPPCPKPKPPVCPPSPCCMPCDPCPPPKPCKAECNLPEPDPCCPSSPSKPPCSADIDRAARDLCLKALKTCEEARKILEYYRCHKKTSEPSGNCETPKAVNQCQPHAAVEVSPCKRSHSSDNVIRKTEEAPQKADPNSPGEKLKGKFSRQSDEAKYCPSKSKSSGDLPSSIKCSKCKKAPHDCACQKSSPSSKVAKGDCAKPTGTVCGKICPLGKQSGTICTCIKSHYQGKRSLYNLTTWSTKFECAPKEHRNKHTSCSTNCLLGKKIGDICTCIKSQYTDNTYNQASCPLCKKPNKACTCSTISSSDAKRASGKVKLGWDCPKCRKGESACTCLKPSIPASKTYQLSIKSKQLGKLCHCGGKMTKHNLPETLCQQMASNKSDECTQQPAEGEFEFQAPPDDILCDSAGVFREPTPGEYENLNQYYGDCYKNKEYHMYTKDAFFVLQQYMQNLRLPQPSNKIPKKPCS